MTRYRMTIEYDGAGFHGWQKQAKALSVQQVLEDAVRGFCGEETTVHAAGRTDAGVHARANVAHVDIRKETDAGTLRDAVNFYVRPHRVAVIDAAAVSDDFHARFSAAGRRYRYIVLNRRAPPALQEGRAWHVIKPLDIGPMQDAARLILGKHDFSTFRAQGCQAKSPDKTLDRLAISRDGEQIMFEAAARSFLYHQVRNMVGTLIMVGTGQWTVQTFAEAFAAKNRSAGGPTAPPQGLIFWDVAYPN